MPSLGCTWPLITSSSIPPACLHAWPPGYRPYLEVARPSAAVSRLEDLLADYNGLAGPGKRQLHLAMFLYAVEHVTRIARCVEPGGPPLQAKAQACCSSGRVGCGTCAC
mgnify:CR=1 FL=1